MLLQDLIKARTEDYEDAKVGDPDRNRRYPST